VTYVFVAITNDRQFAMLEKEKKVTAVLKPTITAMIVFNLGVLVLDLEMLLKLLT
jgi:hypothetical protein